MFSIYLLDYLYYRYLLVIKYYIFTSDYYTLYLLPNTYKGILPNKDLN